VAIALIELTGYYPKEFKKIIIRVLYEEDENASQLHVSDMTLQFVRPKNYFSNTMNKENYLCPTMHK
jgi:hypothetical protein